MQNFLNEGTPGYRNDTGVTDVATIIANLTTLATGLATPWGQSGGGVSPTTLTSPVDAAGRQFTIVLTRISATSLQAAYTDGQSRSVTFRMNISGSGDSIFYYVSPYRCMIDAFVSGNPEYLYGVMLDESPELQTSHNRWLVAKGSRNSSGSYTSTSAVGTNFIVDSTGGFASKTTSLMYPQATSRSMTGSSDGKTNSRTLGGSNVFYPCIQVGDSVASTYKIFGKWYGNLLASGPRFVAGAEVTVPLDDSVTGVFKFLQLNFASNDNTRQCVRKS